MRRLYLSVLSMYIGILAAHSQKPVSSVADSGNYRPRTLAVDEINFVSAYYHQNGNNSAVTGGTGTEKLSDFANTIAVQLSNVTAHAHKNTFQMEVGLDHYTSASSDKIDPYSISSASKQDTRFYPSVNWTNSNLTTGNSIGFSASYSHEYDYQSFGAGINLTRISADKKQTV
jgi:hypothetical protein